MNEEEIFRLENEIERLKNQGSVRLPTFPLLLAFGLMVVGIVLSVLGQPGLGYNLALVGFIGFAIVYGLQNFLRRQQQNREFHIQDLERRIEELRKR